MGKRVKAYSKTSEKYAQKLRDKGYFVRFNFIDEEHYEDVTVRGPKFNGYGYEFNTPRHAYEYVTKTGIR